jgi:hypothetical protein
MSSRQRPSECVRRKRGRPGTTHRITLVTSPAHVRDAFRRLDLEERAARGEFVERVREVKRRTAAAGDQRALQEIVEWWSGGTLVAIVHRWRDAEGRLAASGHHDPKWLAGGGVIALQAADVNEKRTPSHDYRRLTSWEFEPIIVGWPEPGSMPLWGMKCANCGRLWIELLTTPGGSQFHTEAQTVEELLGRESQ